MKQRPRKPPHSGEDLAFVSDDYVTLAANLFQFIGAVPIWLVGSKAASLPCALLGCQPSLLSV
jgi:hypothetical protein